MTAARFVVSNPPYGAAKVKGSVGNYSRFRDKAGKNRKKAEISGTPRAVRHLCLETTDAPVVQLKA